MKAVVELLEGFFIVLVLGVVVLLGAATLIHSFNHPYDPHYRADLTTPPFGLVCPDVSNHCRAYQ